MSRSLPNIHLDGFPTVSFAFDFVFPYYMRSMYVTTQIMMNIISLLQQEEVIRLGKEMVSGEYHNKNCAKYRTVGAKFMKSRSIGARRAS